MAQIDNVVLDKLQTFIAVLKNNGISVESAYLFGSYATNSAGNFGASQSLIQENVAVTADPRTSHNAKDFHI